MVRLLGANYPDQHLCRKSSCYPLSECSNEGDVTGDSGGDIPSEGPSGENPVLMERRPRHSREEIRALLLEMGRSILREEGPGSGAEVVTFKKVLERLEEGFGIRLTNASVIGRVWENQAEFQADLLVTIALEENQDEIDLTVGAVVPILTDADLTTVESRHAVMRELCRVGGAANLQAMRLSDNWPLWISVWGIARTAQPVEQREKIRAALVAGYDAFNDRIEDAYLAITALLGFRLREGFTLRQFTIAVDCLGQGFGLRDRVDNTKMDGIIRSTGPGGAPQEWTLFAIGFESLVQQFFEIDPGWHPDAGAA